MSFSVHTKCIVFTASVLALAYASSGNEAVAQTLGNQDLKLRSPAAIPFDLRRSPARRDQLCVFTGENYTGYRKCFDPMERTHQPRPFNRTIRSFTVPYGYEAEFYNDLILDKPDTPVELLCTYRQTNTQRYSMGVDALKMRGTYDDGSNPYGFGRCIGPKPNSALATQLAFRKIPTITDAQRDAVWAGWELNDNENCGVRIYPRLPITDTTRIRPRSQADRANCYGRRVDMSDLSQLYHPVFFDPSLMLKNDISEIHIASGYGRIELFERPNFQGRSVRLGCGNYRMSPAMATQFKSARVLPIDSDPSMRVANCSSSIQTISSWGGLPPNLTQPIGQRVPRP
jgi:hypothetical protein